MTSAIVVNYYDPAQELSILIEVGVSYDSDLEHVERVTIEVCKEVMTEVAGGVADFEPFIRYHTFADFSINFTVIVRGQEYVNQYLIKHEFVKRLHRRYQEEGIVIPFPIRTLHPYDAQPLQVTDLSAYNGQRAQQRDVARSDPPRPESKD
jgi:small-conductance mechanosensitive channel